jgi:archaellum component FlaG (FlaF/FlaG flagellin family)
VKEGSTVHDTDTTTFKVNDCESKPCKVWIEIIDKYCKGYRVYVDGNYQFTEGQSGTPDGYCRFDVTPGTHKFELCKDRCTVSKSWYCQCGTYYSWVSMNDMYPHWCDCNKKPDLIIQDISRSSSSPKQGDKITFTVKIKNQDSGSAGSSRVNYYIDGSSVGSDSVPALSAYRTSTQEFTWTANKCGTVQVKAVADAYNAVDPESNEGNNARTETVSITCTTPDLIIQDISWLPSSPKQGDTITFTVKIKNQDSGSAGSSRVNYYIDGSYVDYASVPALSAYRTSTQEFTWTANKCGTVQVKAVADAYNAVDPESNEGNNDRTGTINVICREKPAPEIVEVKYPPACVKEGEDATISVTVENKGGTSNEGYISVSFPNGEDVSVVSGTGNGYNKLYQKESVIWGKEGIIPSPIDPLVDLLDTNWVKYQQETITMNVKSNSGSDEIVFYVRAALKNADGSYERDPTYSGDKDQQGWYVERHVIDVCPKEACVIIDDDTCVGYEVYVDGASILTEGVGEILDGSCTFSATEGTHTIGIRDNECFAVIARNFQSDTTYRWDSMPKNWCKCNAEVKFRGVIVKESLQTLFYMYKIKIDKILMDPSDVLTSDGEIWIFSSGPATVDDVSIGDNVEGYGKYDGELNREVKLETAEHYLKNLGSQEEKKGRLTIEKIDLNTGCTPKDIKIPGSFGNFDLSDSVARQTRDRNPSVAKEGQIFYVTVKAKAHDSDLQKGQIYVVLVPPTEQTGVYCIERTQEPDKISKDVAIYPCYLCKGRRF